MSSSSKSRAGPRPQQPSYASYCEAGELHWQSQPLIVRLLVFASQSATPGRRSKTIWALRGCCTTARCSKPRAIGSWRRLSYWRKGWLLIHPSRAVLELLIECYMRHAPHNRLDTIAARLKEVAPQSGVLEVLAGVTDEKARDFVKQNSQRAQDLLGIVCDKGSTSMAREAALTQLCQRWAIWRESCHT